MLTEKTFPKLFMGQFQLIRQLLPKSKPNQTKPLITFGCRRQIELTCVKVQRIDFLIGAQRPDHNGITKKRAIKQHKIHFPQAEN